METKNIMIVGVGGQGTLLTSRILGGIIKAADKRNNASASLCHTMNLAQFYIKASRFNNST